MRSSATGLGMSPELERLYRRADSPCGQFLEGLQIIGADIRQRKAQWALADSLVGLQLRDDSGVQLTETVQTLIPERAPHTAYFTDLDLDGRFPYIAATVEWAGTEPAQVEIKRVKAWLHPRMNPAAAQSVYKWRLDLLRVVQVGGAISVPAKRQLYLAPIAEPVYALATGSSEGLVTFDYSVAPVQDRPRPKRFGLPSLLERLPVLFNVAPAPVTILIITALDKNGAPATNVGFGYDNTVASVTTNGNVLSSRRLEQPPKIPGILTPLFQPGTHQDGGAGGGTPRLIIEYGTYANAKITFSAVGNRITLPAVPTNAVIATITGSVPDGTTLVGQVLKDGGNPVLDADWRTFVSGQDITQLANVSLRQTYETRAALNTDASGSLTPVLRKLGIEEQKITPAYDDAGGTVAQVQLRTGYGVDLETLKGEIVRGMIIGIKDGDRDYKSWVENLLGAANLRDYTFRLWLGAPKAMLSKDKWLHIDDYLPEGQAPRLGDYAIAIVSPLVLLRGLLPKKSPGASYAPDGDLSVGTYTTDTGAGANLYQRIDEADADDLDYIQSVLDPVNQVYKATLPTPADLPGRRLYVDYRIQKDVAGGKTIDATIELRQSGALVATSGLQANISDQITPGSFQLTDASVALITDPTNLELWVTFNVGGAGGSRRGRLTWWRFRTEERRSGVSYVNQSVKAVYEDLLANQLELDARFRGPSVEDTTTIVSKAISEISTDEVPTSKDEVDAVLNVIGYGTIASQGRLKAVNMKDPGEVQAIWPMDEIVIRSITLGIEDRIDNPIVPFNWNAIKAEFDDEWEGASSVGILAYWETKLEGPWRLPQEVAKWVAPQPIADYAVLARSIGTRMLDWFGSGRGRAVIETGYGNAELEPGDTVIFEQDQLVIRDPHTGEDRRGRIWLAGKIELCEDEDPCQNKLFTVAIRPLYDLFGPGSAATREGFITPIVRSMQLHVDDGGNVLANISVQGAAAIRIAAAKVGVPSDAAARAAPLQLTDGNEQLTTASLLSIVPTEIGYAKVFAYERADGSGAESLAVTAATPKGTRKRAFVFDDGLYVLRAGNPTGIAAHSSVQLDPANGVAEGGTVYRIYRHREEITVNGADADGDVAVTFSLSYQNPPLVILRGGQYLSFATAFGTGVNHRQRLQALNITASGFTSRAQMLNAGVVTGQNDDFPSGNLLVNVGDTAEADLQPGGANDDSYTVNYRVTVTNPDGSANVALTVAIEINRQDGNGWITAATYVYSRSIAGTQSWNSEAKTILATGLGTGDDIRIRASAFDDNGIGGSFTVRGADGAGANPDTRNGVTYNTASDTTASAIPANGDQVIWVAQEVA